MLGLLGMALVLSACEGNTDRVRIVKNVTTSEITAYVMSYDSVWTTFQIPSGRRETVFASSQFGGSDYAGEPLIDVLGFVIVNSDNDTLKTNLYDVDSWVVYSNQLKKAPSNWEHEFVLYVTDADFD